MLGAQRLDLLARRAGDRRRIRRAREVEQVRRLGLVELQGAGERVEHAVGDAGQIAPLESRVVVDADAGEQRHLFSAEPRNAAVATVCGQAGLVGGDAVAPR